MLARLLLIVLAFMGSFYGLFWLLVHTPFSRSLKAAGEFARYLILFLAAVAATVLAVAFLTSVDNLL